jgi:hypothetical protein
MVGRANGEARARLRVSRGRGACGLTGR